MVSVLHRKARQKCLENLQFCPESSWCARSSPYHRARIYTNSRTVNE